MSSVCDPAKAPIGDVGTAMFLIDSQLKAFQNDMKEPDPEQREFTDRLIRSFDVRGAGDVLDGACTLIYLFTRWLREAHDGNDQSVIEDVVPYIVTTLRNMPRSVRPESIPTIAALIIASVTDQSPALWRRQYGEWNGEEMGALEAATFLLAHYINNITGDGDTATRMVMELLSSAEQDDEGGSA